MRSPGQRWPGGRPAPAAPTRLAGLAGLAPLARLARLAGLAGLAGLLAITLAGCGAGSAPRHPATAGSPGSGPATNGGRPPVAAGHLPSGPAAELPAPTGVPGGVPPGTLPPVVSHGPRSRREVALTFDADLTPLMRHRLQTGAVRSYADMRIVTELRRAHAPATFFFTGLWMDTYPAQTRQIATDRDFELATHSYTHRGFRARCYGLGQVPPAQQLDEASRPIGILDRLTHRATRYFRFPGGCYDAAALRALAPLGITAVQYDVASGDAFGTSAAAIIRQTLAAARNGSIIVMHLQGGPNAPFTAAALPAVLDGLRARGLRPVTLSTLLAGG